MISVIVPAYNEEDRIEKTLEEYSKGLKSVGDFEIIVVCDGCKDRTAEIAAKYAKVLTFPNRLGKGGGVLEGFKVARGDVIGFTDADNSLKVDQFLKLIEEMEKTGAGCVIADRKSKEAIIVESQFLIRRVASDSFNLLFPRLLFGLKLKDTQCGGKIFKREYVDAVASQMACMGFEFDVELLWRMKNAGCAIREVPVVWKDDKGSKFSFKYIPAMGVNLLKTRFGMKKK